MATDISRITNAALAVLIYKMQEKVGTAVANVLRHHAHYEERFLDIIDRLGSDNIDVQTYKNLNARLTELETEAYMRVGPPVYRSQYPTMLRNFPRYKRIK